MFSTHHRKTPAFAVIFAAVAGTSCVLPEELDEILETFYGEDPKRDFECNSPTDFEFPEAIDVARLSVEPTDDGNTRAEMGFHGPIADWAEQMPENTSFGMDLYFDGERFEFKWIPADGTPKVVYGNADIVDWMLDGEVFAISVEKKFKELDRASAGSTLGLSGGLCEDRLEVGPGGNNDTFPPGDSGGDTGEGTAFRYVRLRDLSSGQTGDAGGADVDYVMMCDDPAGEAGCIYFTELIQESGVLNAAGFRRAAGGADACDTGDYVSLNAGFLIGGIAMDIALEPGKFIVVQGLNESECPATGPDAEQTYEVAVGTSTDASSFVVLGECGTESPCGHVVPEP